MHHGLAELLGACDDVHITYRYIDAVRPAGHSCPTVAGTGDFKGLGGRFRRQDLMAFDGEVSGEVCFERSDNGAFLTLATQMNRVEADPHAGRLLHKILSDMASPQEKTEFASLWQDRVRRILVDHADDPELIIEI